MLNSGSSTRLYGMRLTATSRNGAIRGQPVDSHVIICHTSVTCETSLLCLYIYHIRRVNMIKHFLLSTSTIRSATLSPCQVSHCVLSGADLASAQQRSGTYPDRPFPYPSAFANVHTLELPGVETHHFMPGIKRYFKHLSPALRSLSLINAYCTPRQLSHFLSFFELG